MVAWIMPADECAPGNRVQDRSLSTGMLTERCVMAEQTCGSGGVHRLPAGEESWKSPRCDVLVAAALDGCQPCQNRLIADLSESLTDDFGKLFTTWVMQTIDARAELGARVPGTMLELFGSGGAVLSAPGRRALRGVRLPQQGPSMPYGAAVRVDPAGATAALMAMTPAERAAVLGDALDGIVGAMAL
ncbi:hypothetical protein [Streptomyces sp. NPDC002067]